MNAQQRTLSKIIMRYFCYNSIYKIIIKKPLSLYTPARSPESNAHFVASELNDPI